jgi:hypothetical protein
MMATPVAEQALLLAKQMGIENPSPEVIETYTRILARTSLVVPLGPTRSTLRGNAEDNREYPDEKDYAFFKEMLEKTAINEFFQNDEWGPHRVLMDMYALDDQHSVPAYRVFWNERQGFLSAHNEDVEAFKAVVEPMVASVSMLLGADWASWVLDIGQKKP